MDFLIWATRTLHLFAVVVWVGGLMFQSAVIVAVARAEGMELTRQTVHVIGRFLPFVWMSVWTVLVTGIVLMLFSPRFVLLEFHDRWSVLLLVKQLAFTLMVVFSIGTARMYYHVQELMRGAHEHESMPYYRRIVQFARINVALGIASVLAAVGMR